MAEMPSPDVIKRTLPAVVQIVALKRSAFGSMQSAWTGSGTIVDPSGIILTNCHVANPRAMGMSSPEADALAIALTENSDMPPAVSYIAQIVAYSPELDLAVLKIVSDLQGKKPRSLRLPAVPLGDSDTLELADSLAIFGFPGIGGETVTFTSGSVSGFQRHQGLDARAWIKTDATIAGGNSGGTAINQRGQLVGIPTQAAAGDNITPVDARPVVDTNRDGRIDHRDTPMAIGGFINGLRPVNLARPLLQKAGLTVGAGNAPGPAAQSPAAQSPAPAAPAPVMPDPVVPAAPPPTQPTGGGARISNLVFSAQVTQDGRPVNPAAILPPGIKNIFATFQFDGMRKGTVWNQVWAVNGQKVLEQPARWEHGTKGRQVLTLGNAAGMPEGSYHLVLTIGSQVAAEGKVVIGRQVDDTDTEILGRIVDGRGGQGIRDALVIALKPNVRVMDFVNLQNKNMAYTYARTAADGSFTFPQQLPKGQAYGLVVIARGYRDLVVEAGLRIGPDAPERAQMNPIGMQPE